jgi:hypothetical protein
LSKNAAKYLKVIRGNYVVTDALKLKLTQNGQLDMEAEFTVTAEKFTLFPPNRRVVHIRLDSRGIAKLTREELADLDSATDRWAVYHRKKSGERPSVEEIQTYFERNTRIYLALGDPTGPKDVLGNPFGPLIADTMQKVHPATVIAVSDAVPREFWKPYID